MSADFFLPSGLQLSDLPTPQYYYDPQGVNGGTGTELDPWTSLSSLQAGQAALGAPAVIGIRMGADRVEIASTPLTSANQIVRDEIGHTWVPYGGDPATDPLAKLGACTILTDSAADWIEFDPDDALNADGTPVTPQAGTNFWVNPDVKKSITWAGFGSVDAVEAFRGTVAETVRSTAPHSGDRAWLNADGTIDDDFWRPRSQFQWATDSPGLVVYSVGNPATVAGGPIYLAASFDSPIRFRASSVWRHACSGYGAGAAVYLNNAAGAAAIQPDIQGLYGAHVGRLAHIRTAYDQGFPPGPGTGTLWRPIGQPYNDYTSLDDVPWIEATIDGFEGRWLGYGGFVLYGWLKNTVMRNGTMTDLGATYVWSGLSATHVNPPSDEPNIMEDVTIDRVYCTGPFAYSDASGIDLDTNAGSFIARRVTVSNAYQGISYSAGRPDCVIDNCTISNCARGIYLSDLGDGGAEATITGGTEVMVPALGTWSAQFLDRKIEDSPAVEMGIQMQERLGLPHAGPNPIGLTEYDYPERAIVLDGLTIDAPTGTYAIYNGTTDRVGLAGPWDDEDGNGVAANGQPITPGTRQLQRRVDPVVLDLTLPGAGADYVDHTGAPLDLAGAGFRAGPLDAGLAAIAAADRALLIPTGSAGGSIVTIQSNDVWRVDLQAGDISEPYWAGVGDRSREITVGPLQAVATGTAPAEISIALVNTQTAEVLYTQDAGSMTFQVGTNVTLQQFTITADPA